MTGRFSSCQFWFARTNTPTHKHINDASFDLMQMKRVPSLEGSKSTWTGYSLTSTIGTTIAAATAKNIINKQHDLCQSAETINQTQASRSVILFALLCLFVCLFFQFSQSLTLRATLAYSAASWKFVAAFPVEFLADSTRSSMLLSDSCWASTRVARSLKSS